MVVHTFHLSTWETSLIYIVLNKPGSKQVLNELHTQYVFSFKKYINAYIHIYILFFKK